MMSRKSSSSTDTNAPAADRHTLVEGVKTVVVKVGTNVISRDCGEMAMGRIYGLIEELVDLQRSGRRVILVSSGAISMGMHCLGIERRPTDLRDKQACAAVGQSRLMSVYQQAFDRFGIATAQILLTEEDFTSRRRYLNLRNTMSRLIELDVLPIVNENDSLSTSEIEESADAASRSTIFGDNDHLSALVASKLEADLLILLTDVDGLYPHAPADTPGSETLQELRIVDEITDEVLAMAGQISTPGSARGRGGMLSKIEAIRIAVQSGVPAVIANGFESGTVQRVLAGEEVGTLFTSKRRLRSRKHWIAFASATEGCVYVNDGARDALLHRGSSLLFGGIVKLDSEFHRGDVLSIVDANGHEFARGMSNYSSETARGLIGKGREAIAAEVNANYPEFITRDNIALRD